MVWESLVKDLVSRRLGGAVGLKGFPPDAPTHVHTCDPSNPFNPWCRPGVPASGHTGTTCLAGRAEEMGYIAKIERKEGFLYFDDKFIDENWVILVASSVCMCTFDYIVSLDLRNPTLYTNGKSPAVQEYAFACLTIFHEGGNPPRI